MFPHQSLLSPLELQKLSIVSLPRDSFFMILTEPWKPNPFPFFPPLFWPAHLTFSFTWPRFLFFNVFFNCLCYKPWAITLYCWGHLNNVSRCGVQPLWEGSEWPLPPGIRVSVLESGPQLKHGRGGMSLLRSDYKRRGFRSACPLLLPCSLFWWKQLPCSELRNRAEAASQSERTQTPQSAACGGLSHVNTVWEAWSWLLPLPGFQMRPQPTPPFHPVWDLPVRHRAEWHPRHIKTGMCPCREASPSRLWEPLF